MFNSNYIIMKKLFLIGLAATAMLTSCSNDETKEALAPKGIGFSNAFIDNSVRSVSDPSITTATIENFDVWGYMGNPAGVVFGGEAVTKSGSDWVYTNIKYWTANDYYFDAVAPSAKATVTATTAGEAGTNPVAKIEFTNTATSQVDLLYAQSGKQTGTITRTEAVAFTFKHLLSKVKFNFGNGFNTTAQNTTLKVTDIKIKNADTKGTYTTGAGTLAGIWTIDDATALELAFGAAPDEATEIAEQANCDSYNEMLLIPTTKTLNVTFTVEMLVGGVSAGVWNHTATVAAALSQGCSYCFTATLDHTNIVPGDDELQPIKFTVTEVSDWDAQDSQGIVLE